MPPTDALATDVPPTGTPTYVSVIGASVASPELAAKAEELGELLAEAGCVVVCGGRDGVMAAVARGVKAKGGVCIGIMPEADRSRANDDLTYSVCSAMGYARNISVAASGDVVIAVGGAWGTLSEIALARNLGRTVVLLDSWTVRPPGADPDMRASLTAWCGQRRPPRPCRSLSASHAAVDAAARARPAVTRARFLPPSAAPSTNR